VIASARGGGSPCDAIGSLPKGMPEDLIELATKQTEAKYPRLKDEKQGQA
jgi:hypothetical protein